MCLGPLRQRSLKLSYDALPRPAAGLAVIVPRKLNVEQVCLSIEWPNLGKSVCDCVELLEQRYPIGLDNWAIRNIVWTQLLVCAMHNRSETTQYPI
jgi:hypothetical protein